MEKQSKLSLAGFIVITFVILFIVLILIPIRTKLIKMNMRHVCGTNLKGLGTAITVYSNDYDDNYPQLPGGGPWAQDLGFPYYLRSPNFETAQSNTLRTISASLYLLVKEADIAPKSFVCPWANQEIFDGSNPKNLDLVDLWDFGPDPYKHVSYSYHNPYGKFPADATRSAAFAIAADMNPWFQDGHIIPPGVRNKPPQIIGMPLASEDARETDDITLRQRTRELWSSSNSLNELSYKGPFEKKAEYPEGQNVLFADGHTATENTPNVGVKNDNIYTFWSTDENPSEQDIQGGTAPTSRSADNDAKSETDSFLTI